MEILVILVMLALAALSGALFMHDHMIETQPERERALRDELEALYTAQLLSIAAWQARQHMADVVRDGADDG